jgi:hypothetical protein
VTYDDVNKMAREAGCIPHRRPEYWNDVQIFATPEVLFIFANLVAAHEREACAKWAELVAREIDNTNNTATYIASGIRAREDK